MIEGKVKATKKEGINEEIWKEVEINKEGGEKKERQRNRKRKSE